MNAESFERKLTAILSADVAGYSQFMGEDDNAAVRAPPGNCKIRTLEKEYD